MQFDLKGAREAGWTDAEIAEGLASRMGFNISGAREAGWTDTEIAERLANYQPPSREQTPAPQQGTAQPAVPQVQPKATAQADTGFKLDLYDPSADPDADIPDISGAVNFVTDMAGNVVPSGKRVLEGLGHVIQHPIDTAATIGKVGLGAAQKLPFVPGTQFVPYADAMGNMIADRYGSLDKAAETLRTDPVGALMDAALLTTGAGAAVSGAGKAAQIGNASRVAGALGKAGQMLTKTGQIADPLTPLSYLAKPVTVPVKSAAKAAGKFFTPEEIYARAAKLPPRSMSKRDRDKALNAAVSERIPLTEEGIDKANRLIREIGKETKAVLSDPKYDNVRIDPLEIAMKAEGEVRPLFEKQADNVADLAAIDSTLNNFYKAHSQPLTLAEANELKSGTYAAQNKRAWDERKGASVETEKAIARALKEAVDDAAPEIRALNARQGGLLSLAGELPQAVNRTGNHSIFNMVGSTGAGAGLGALIGGPVGATLGGMGSIALRHPAVQSGLAFAADAVRKGYRGTKGVRDAISKGADIGKAMAYLQSIYGDGILSRFERDE